MRISRLISALNETGLSPESLAPRLGISGMTYRRWMKSPGQKDLPKAYERTVIEGIYQLLVEGLLDLSSDNVKDLIAHSSSLYYQAVMKNLGVGESWGSSDKGNIDQMILGLTQMGTDLKKRADVEHNMKRIRSMMSFGEEWKDRIGTLVSVIRSSILSTTDKLVAFGALFYLLTPFDLIPDYIPVVGYLDDFAILGIATSVYMKKFPSLFAQPK